MEAGVVLQDVRKRLDATAADVVVGQVNDFCCSKFIFILKDVGIGFNAEGSALITEWLCHFFLFSSVSLFSRYRIRMKIVTLVFVL